MQTNLNKKFLFWVTVVSVTITLMLSSCKKDDPSPQPVTIDSFTPTFGLPGIAITIKGSNFSTTPANNAVTINGMAADVTAATATELTITVPANATTGKIAVTFNNLTATSADDLEVLKDIPRSGLVAFYPFNGNANDESGNNLNGTLNGPSLTANRFGTADRAYNFNGTSDFISLGNPPLLQINNTITLSGWINLDAFNFEIQIPRIILSKISFSPNRGYIVGQTFTDSGTPSLFVAHYSSVGLTLTNNSLGSTISASTWIFFTLTIDGKSWKFYQNGVFTHGTTVTSTVNILDVGSMGNMLIGQYGGGDFFDGSIDDIAIYNRALTDTEVTQLYKQTVSKY